MDAPGRSRTIRVLSQVEEGEMLRTVTALAVSVFMLIGCAAAAPTSTPTAQPTTAPTLAPTSPPTAAPTLAPTATPSPGPTAAPTAAPTPPPAADISTFNGTPGTFQWSGFQVVTVNIDSGWSFAGTEQDYFALIRGAGPTSTGGLTVNTFPGTAYSDACTGPGTETKGDSSVQAFFDLLSAAKGITVSNAQPVTISGFQGMSADIATKSCAGSGRIWLWQTPISGDFHLNTGESAKIWAVDNGGTTVVITAEGFHGDADLSEMLPSVEAMISTMVIAGP